MDKEKIFLELSGIFIEIFNDDTLVIDEGTTANDVDKWDSLTHMLLVQKVEKHFKIKFKLKELNKMENVGDMLELIHQKSS